MDRCRCEDYAAAVRKIKFYTVGTLRPDIIENYDRSQFVTAWIKNRVGVDDLRFTKPKAWLKVPPPRSDDNKLSEESRRREQMWCPYMSPVKLPMYETSA